MDRVVSRCSPPWKGSHQR